MIEKFRNYLCVVNINNFNDKNVHIQTHSLHIIWGEGVGSEASGGRGLAERQVEKKAESQKCVVDERKEWKYREK